MKRLFLTLALALAPALATAGAARAADSLYEITKVEPKVAVGGTGTASLTIKVKGGWHVNDEAPISVALTPPTGVTVGKQKLTRGDLAASSKESARFDIPVTATEAGKKTIGAEAHFVLCQEQACKPVKETLTLAIEVTPPAVASKKKKN
jgi:Disulphide bond corrector protein DsbC